MRQKIGKKVLFYAFILVFFGTFNNQKLPGLSLLDVKDIIIESSDNSNFSDILDKISDQKKSNIFLISKDNIKKKIEANSLVENYFVIKNYPSTLKIKIIKTKFLSRLNIEGKIFLVGTNGKLTEDLFNKTELPFIFGNPSINYILDFNNKIINSKFDINEFTNLFYYKSGRWDLETKDGVIIKLSNEKNLSKQLEEIFVIMSNKNFVNKKIIDARVNNQIIFYD
jgi:cell division septal protein FtsQ